MKLLVSHTSRCHPLRQVLIGLALIGLFAGAPARSAFALDPTRDLRQCRVDSWGAKDGLPPRVIRAMAQTPDGYLWLGTDEGLIRFDGVSFHAYNSLNTPGFARDGITSLMIAHDGRLWVGTDGSGFGQFIRGAFHRVDDQGAVWSVTNAICETPDGTIWLGGEGPHRLSKISRGELTHPWAGYTGAPDACSGLAADSSNDLWATTFNYGSGLVCETPAGRQRIYGKQDGLPSLSLTAICRAPDGGFWIGTRANGLCRFKNGRFTTYTVRDGLPSDCIQTLYVDREGTLWIGTRDGLGYRRHNRFEVFRKVDGLFDNDVQALLEDREGDLWAASATGVTRFANTELTPVTLRTQTGGLVKHLGMCQAADGSLWFATDSGVQHLSQGKIRIFTTHDGLPSDNVVSVTAGPDGAIWTADRDNHLCRSQNGKFALVSDKACGPLVVHDREGVLLVGLGEIFRWTGKKMVQIPTFPDPQRKFIFSCLTDRRGVLWFASDSGLGEVTRNTSRVFHDGLPPQGKVLSVAEGDDGCLWVGTDHGLGHFRDGHFTLYGVKDGLPDDNIFELGEDQHQTLWVGGSRGIFTVRVADLDAYDNHAIPTLPTVSYTAGDGIRSFPTAFSAGKTRQGDLWFMGDGGFTVADPAHMLRNPLPPAVIIEQVTANRREVFRDGSELSRLSLRLPPGAGNLEVHYTAPSFVAPEKVRFRYQLVGYDAGWVEANTRRAAFYTNLAPGQYSFRVQACNNDGVWNTQGASFRIEFSPHYYQTVWFRALCGLSVLLAVAAIYLLRTRNLRRQNRELEARIAERTSALVKAVDKLQKTTVELVWSNERLQTQEAMLLTQNENLEAQEEELRAQNDDLSGTKALLEVQNEALISVNTRLEALATLDPLTDLPNHRCMVGTIDVELERVARHHHPCALLFLDIDHFKALNDTFGHSAGDAALKEFAAVVRQTLRGVDRLGRWGGEEFVVLLPETDTEGALVAAEHVRQQVADHMFSIAGGLRLTCSVGVSCHPADGQERDELLKAADGAMYAAKRLGRNQVRSAGEVSVRALQDEQDTGSSREETALAGTAQALAALAEAQDSSAGEHPQNVALLAIRLAEVLEMPGAEARQIGLAARLHNIGLVVVPNTILQKPGALTPAEWAGIHQHPVVGAGVVSSVPALRPLAPIIHAHHERWDGTGYPAGMAGTAIPLGARILAVADAYLAMTRPRPYRPSRDQEQVLEEMERCAGSQFDPAVVDALRLVLSEASESVSPAQNASSSSSLALLISDLAEESMSV